MITTILTISLISSMVINIILGWYTRKLLNSVANYESHLTEVYNKDLFYGDPTLESLLKHTTQMADEIQEFLKANEQITLETSDA